MGSRKAVSIALLMAATALAVPQVANARAKTSGASAREAALVARLEKLETEVAQLRGDLGVAHSQQAEAVASAQAATASAAAAGHVAETAVASNGVTAKKLAALETRPQAEGFRDGNTTIKLGGYLKLEAANSHFSNGPVATNTLGRDFYLPATIPTTVGGRGATSQDFTAKQTRLWLNLDSQVAGHLVKGYLETDFQTTASASANVTAGGSQRTTNGYTLALRRAYVQVDRFTFGQDWTTFQYAAALPESTDYVGVTEGTVFVRQPQIRYAQPVGKGAVLQVALENPESALGATNSATPAALAENGTDHMPDLTAKLVLTGKRGEVSLAGIVRQVRGEVTAANALTNGGNGVTATGMGVSVHGHLWQGYWPLCRAEFRAGCDL